MTKRTTKQALFASALSLLLCVSMLIGSTFAWFTDTARTSVNTIQAGKLDITLEQKSKSGEWVNAEGETLAFLDTDSTLWEPGCTYTLPDLRLTNNGTLKLKYDLEITGITGNAKLNEAIIWTIVANGKPYDKNNTIHPLNPKDEIIISISGHMKEDAGNEYQGLTIDGIGITVYATQLGGNLEGVSGEFDSVNNTYDMEAGWPVRIVPTLKEEAMTKTDSGFTYKNSDNTVTANTTAAVSNEAATPGVTVAKAEASTGISVSSNQDTIAYDIEITNLKEDSNGKLVDANDNPATATISFTASENMEGVMLYHEGAAMTPAPSATAVDNANEFYYEPTTGVVTICVDHFSNFTAVYDKPVAYNQANELFTTVQAAIDDADSTTVTLSADVDISEPIDVVKAITLDMAGHKIYNTNSIWEAVETEDSALIMVKTGGSLTITGSGILEAKQDDCYAIDVVDGNLTIENGTIIGNVSAVQIQKGTATINGGSFEQRQVGYGDTYLLNCIDAGKANGQASITVSGGTFKGYDPAEVYCETEKPLNFCAANYETIKSGDYYEVVKKEFIDNGDGTYTITGGKGLRELSELVNSGKNQFAGKTVILANDINLYNEKFTPIGDSSRGFNGTFNGNGKTIYNLLIDNESNKDAHNCAGLFGWVQSASNDGSGGTVMDLTVDGAEVHGHHYTAVIVGYGYAKIENCHVKNAAVINQHLDDEACGDKAGLIIGYQGPGGFVKNCTGSDSTVTGGRDAGQLVGCGYTDQVENCSATNVTVSQETTVACTGANIRNELIGRVETKKS